jgi:hydroxymethylpyrimidine/phosphomethylpyrimidine kinase
LTIAGSDSGGGAGIQADLKTITVLGAYGLSVLTALTAQNTLGVTAVHRPPLDFLEAQLEAVLSDIGADAAKTGMLADAEVIRIVAAKLRQYRVPNLVVDPVMISKGGDALLAPEACQALMEEMLPLATVLTPNLPEAETMLGRKIATQNEMVEAARALKAMGPRAVLMKGGHALGPATDIFFDGERVQEFTAPRIDTLSTHGTGCTLSAAIAAYLGQGRPAIEAVGLAKVFISEAIRLAQPLGHGHGPVYHFVLLEKDRVLKSLLEAFDLLARSEAGELVPEVQTNIGYALPGARGQEDVAAFPGRIVRLGAGVARVAEPCFGASHHVASIILTAMAADPRVRAAMNIRFGDDILARARQRNLVVAGFDRTKEPAEVKAREGSSLEWGIGEAIRQAGRVPDLIFDRGDMGKEPMIRVLGRDPAAVVAKALSLLDERDAG